MALVGKRLYAEYFLIYRTMDTKHVKLVNCGSFVENLILHVLGEYVIFVWLRCTPLSHCLIGFSFRTEGNDSLHGAQEECIKAVC